MWCERDGDGWWLVAHGGEAEGWGWRPGAGPVRAGPFAARPRALGTWERRRRAADGRVWAEWLVAWALGGTHAATSAGGTHPRGHPWAGGARSWEGFLTPPPGGPDPPPGLQAPPDGDPEGADPEGRACWDAGLGWRCMPRLLAELAAFEDEARGEEGARDLLARAPHLGTPQALMAAGFLTRAQAGIAAPRLEAAWAGALG